MINKLRHLWAWVSNGFATTFDMLAWIHADPKYMAGKHMQKADYNSTVIQPKAGRIYTVKSANGYPADIVLYDNNLIYLWVTELTRSDPPTNYKKTYYNTTIPFCKRFSKNGDFVLSTNSTIGIYTGCNLQRTFVLGDVKCQLQDLGVVNVGDSVGKRQVLEMNYYWGGNGHQTGIYNVRERFYYAYPFGLITWDTSNWNGHGYTLVQAVPMTIVASGAATPNFPQCPGF